MNYKFITYYSDDKDRGNSFLAATNKLDYIFSCLGKLGHTVAVLSESSVSLNGKILPKKDAIINGVVKIKYPIAFPGKNLIQKIIRKLFSSFLLKRFLNRNLNCGETVFIYHSVTDHKYLSKLIKRKKLNVILEVEEIYGDVSNNQKLRQREMEFFKCANSYLFPTQLLDKAINKSGKPSVIIHGTYNVEKDYGEKFNDERIHCVYAGTFDPRKGGAAAAAEAAEYLDDRYQIHILGFGSEKDREVLIHQINDLQCKTRCKLTFEGLKSGAEYIRFIQKCDIGLSTQNPDAAFNNTSFPSKILSYMANGLRVVSIRIPAIECSAIGDYISYYDEQTPQKIAEAIMHVNMNDKNNSKEIIAELNKKFRKEINDLINCKNSI